MALEIYKDIIVMTFHINTVFSGQLSRDLQKKAETTKVK